MKRKEQPTVKSSHLNLKPRLQEGLFIANSAIALFLLLALITCDPSSSVMTVTSNIGGHVGNMTAILAFRMFGYLAYLFPFLLVYWGWLGWQGQFEGLKLNHPFWLLQGLGLLSTVIAGCGLSTVLQGTKAGWPYNHGGLLGVVVAKNLLSSLNFLGTSLLLWTLLLMGITLTTGFSWFALIDKLGRGTLSLWVKCLHSYRHFKTWLLKRQASRQRASSVTHRPAKRIPPLQIGPDTPRPATLKPGADPPQEPTPQLNVSKISNTEILPTLELLDPAEGATTTAYSDEELTTLSRNVELRLKDFGIVVQVVAVHPGPVVTRFEMQLAAGIKVSRISSLVKDLARSLSVISVRIVEIIPGKSVVGLELPNRRREVVRLRTILNSQPYRQARSPLSLALGKDIAGHPVIVDLAKMPHLLVAGTTGSGKSVGLNAMLLSLLYKATVEQTRLIMIDPKMLELAIYEGIPHLLAPVVTDMKEAANALRWCVAEMDRRYKLMAALGVRNLAGYNQYVQEAKKPLTHPNWRPEYGTTPEILTSLPHIIVLIDEFADMMMVVGKKVEELIARIAQKARAAGIHLILATQRPSVDVITGLIKANIPTRIAFQVSSKIDSRTILDQQGAEQLLGHGDMLYLAPGTGLPIRIHGAFVADHEVHNVVNSLKQAGPPNYMQAITEETTVPSEETAEVSIDDLGEQDPLYDQAVQIVLKTRRASISGVQRRLKIGYNRAARLIETMEKTGIVSAMESNGNREILVPTQREETSLEETS